MTRSMTSAALLLTASVIVLSFSGCQPGGSGTNRDATRSAATTPTPEPVNKPAIEAELLQLEREWTTSVQKHDLEAVKRIEADDIFLTFPDGTTGTKADDLRDVESGALTADSYEIADAKVTVLAADIAIVTGRTLVKNGKYKSPEAKAIDISGQYRFTDVFAKRNGKWQVVASHATKIVNPVAAPSPTAVAPPAPPIKTAPTKPTP